MKKLLCGVLVSLFLFSICGVAFAGGAGNCVQSVRKTTDFLGAGAAFEYNYVDHRMNKMQNKYGARNMEITKVNQVYGKGIIGLGDYVNWYAKVGGANYKVKFIGPSQDMSVVADLNDGIYGGTGLNAQFDITSIGLGDCGSLGFGIGFDIQGNFAYNTVKELTIDNITAKAIGGSFYMADGQNSLYLTCKYDWDMTENIKLSFLPYIGGYHSWAVCGTGKALTYETTKRGYCKKDFQGAYDVTSFGVLTGIDLDIAKYINLNVEGRFVGETAITTGATLKF